MSYQEKKKEAVESLLRLKPRGKVSLKPKFTSHFFRNRKKKNKLDLNKFNSVLKVDVKNKIVEVEGMCTFYDLASEVLKHGLLPVIVPELRNITIGGAISGLGLESSSFIYGMVHNSVIECNVLISTGEVITCSRTQNVIIEGKLTDNLPSGIEPKSFKMRPYWRFIADKNNTKLYITTWNYLWRWDRDAFWSVGIGWMGKLTENELFRLTLGRYFLRSHILGKINHLKRRYFKTYGTGRKEAILQDLCIDINKCPDFFDWYNREIFVYPMWICPFSNRESAGKYVLHNLKFDYLVDIGIYTGKLRKVGKAKNYYNRLLERKVLELGGIKALYSESHFTEDEFWTIYDKDKYFKYKKRFDPEGIFPDIYSKTVGSKTL